MQNYLDLSTSVDTQSIQSQVNEHPEDQDTLGTKHLNDSEQGAERKLSDSVFVESDTHACEKSELENSADIEKMQKEEEGSLIDFSDDKNQTDQVSR